MKLCIYALVGDLGDETYDCLGTVAIGPDGALAIDGDERLHAMIDDLRSTRVGAAMTPQEFLCTLPGRVNPYMGYVEEMTA